MKRCLIYSFICSVLGISVGGAAEKLNVLFIAADHLRADLPCMRNKEVLTPNLDALAARGRLFNKAYCQQAVCNPSRASLMTGLRPDTLKIWDLPTHFRHRLPDVVTLPQHFMKQGYFTQNIGKIYHNWGQEKEKGDAPSWSVPAVNFGGCLEPRGITPTPSLPATVGSGNQSSGFAARSILMVS